MIKPYQTTLHGFMQGWKFGFEPSLNLTKSLEFNKVT